MNKNAEPTFMIKRWHVFAALVPLALLAGLLIGYFLWGEPLDDARSEAALWEEVAKGNQDTAGGPAAGDPAAAATAPAPQQTETPTRYDVAEDDDPALGSEDAPITIIEFSDYQCPFCARWHNETFPRLMENYGDQIRFVYRDFPGSSHPEAIPAAIAANCAGEQGQYFEYQALLYSEALPLGESAYVEYAQTLELDMDEFDSCRSDENASAEIEADLEYAYNFGVRSTPTFFINGLAVVGAQPYDLFATIIDQELAGEIP
jgi:protein-disulfide isomerase